MTHVKSLAAPRYLSGVSSLFSRTLLRIRYYRNSRLPWPAMLLRLFIDTLAKLGTEVEPYHLIREGADLTNPSRLEAGNDVCEYGFLGPADMEVIALLPGPLASSREELIQRLEEGKKCFGAKHRGQIVPFTWCDLRACTFRHGPVFNLKSNESYLFDTHTMEAFRGRGIAPRMRYRFYQELAKLGSYFCANPK